MKIESIGARMCVGIAIGLMTTVFSHQLLAVPADGILRQIKQSDGTLLYVRLVGDEYIHWEETANGDIIIKNTNGIYEYAILDENNQLMPSGNKADDTKKIADDFTKKQVLEIMRQRREEIINEQLSLKGNISSHDFKKAAKSSYNFAKGNQRVLCILMDFPDKSFQIDRAVFDSIWNGENYMSGSVKKYYQENSYDFLNVHATVVGPYTASHNSEYYSYDRTTTANVQQLIKEALNSAKNDVNFSKFDLNQDGYIDVVHVVFAGHGREYLGSDGYIWSHRAWLGSWKVQDFYANDYFCTPELNYGTGNSVANIGPICHEYGHFLGSPDFYAVGNDDLLGTDQWDVMGSGCYNNHGRTPAHHNPYTKCYIYNWCSPVTISSKGTYLLAPCNSDDAFYRINTATNGEFYLLENKAKLGFNSGISGSGGMLVYHIHKDIQDGISNHNVNSTHPQKCYIVSSIAPTALPTSDPSSYGTNQSRWAFPNAIYKRCFLTANTTPSFRSWDNVSVGKDICFIQKVGNSIQFSINPEIEGPSYLVDQEVYSVPDIPSTAKIKWTYSAHETPLSVPLPPGPPVTFVDGDSTASVVVRRGRDETTSSISNFTRRRFYQGQVTLRAQISSGGYTHTIDRVITFGFPPSEISVYDGDSLQVEALEREENYEINVQNPVKKNGLYKVRVKATSEYDANFDACSMELWNNRGECIKAIQNYYTDFQLSTNDLTSGMYFILLKKDGKVIRIKKILVL